MFPPSMVRWSNQSVKLGDENQLLTVTVFSGVLKVSEVFMQV